MTRTRTTYDGEPIAPEPPFGATVVVFRRGALGPEFLVLHRAHSGADHEGDWAWTPPAGARKPDEPPEACALRELKEETGLETPIRPTTYGSAEWRVFAAEVTAEAAIRLDAEHDRFAWVDPVEAVRRCRPEQVAEPLRRIARDLVEAGRAP